MLFRVQGASQIGVRAFTISGDLGYRTDNREQGRGLERCSCHQLLCTFVLLAPVPSCCACHQLSGVTQEGLSAARDAMQGCF